MVLNAGVYRHVFFTTNAKVTLYWSSTHWTTVQLVKAACTDACMSKKKLINKLIAETNFVTLKQQFGKKGTKVSGNVQMYQQN